MSISEIKKEGLERQYRLHIAFDTIHAHVEKKLQDARAKMIAPGFRKGKVPLATVKQHHEESITQEIISNAAQKEVQAFVKENAMELALQPSITLENYTPEDGLTCLVHLEIMPDISEVSFEEITLPYHECENMQEAIDHYMGKMSSDYKKQGDGYAVQDNDQLVVDFKGMIDKVPFEGGTAADYTLIIGSKNHIPGFEEQLIGGVMGEERIIQVTFPENYGAKNLAGKDAEFIMNIKEIRHLENVDLDDEVAKKKGYKSLEHMKEVITTEIGNLYKSITRKKAKQDLFDILEEKCNFVTPVSLVNREYESLLKNETQMHDAHHEHTEDCNHGEDEVDEETKSTLRSIADRRVRIGLFLLNLAKNNGISVEEKDLREAVSNYMRYSPQEGQKLIETLNKNPQRIEELKGPILEDKMVDFILEKVQKEIQKIDYKAFEIL